MPLAIPESEFYNIINSRNKLLSVKRYVRTVWSLKTYLKKALIIF